MPGWVGNLTENGAVKLRDLRRYEVQASYAVALALGSLVPTSSGILLTWRNYHHDIGQIVYGSGSPYVPVFLLSVLLSMVLAALGFVLGWNSAGQRRNDRPGRSWLGFFLGGAVLTADTVLVLAFLMLRFEQPV